MKKEKLYQSIHFSELDFVFCDIDDSLLDLTKTLDQFSEYPIDYSKTVSQGRWVDTDQVFTHLNKPLEISYISYAFDLLNFIESKLILVSAARDTGLARYNRSSRFEKYNINFFDSDQEKKVFLMKCVSEKSLTIDDKPTILEGLKGRTVLVNPELNQNGISLKQLISLLK